ncbi:MAG TPA: carbohydrate kinase family protein [Anaerolineae bacterium]|nr:carbohydrate kinase family protein [Anaerolineae bacterium]
MAPEFVTVGGITLDWVIAPTGEVGIKRCGGNALYSAVGAYLWNEQIAVVSHVGNDFPVASLEDFAHAGIDISGIRRLDEPHELMFSAHYDSDGNRRYFRPHETLPALGFMTPEAREQHVLFYGEHDVDIAKHFDPMPDEMPLHLWSAKAFHLGGMRYNAQLAFARALYTRAIPFSLDPGFIQGESTRRQLLSLVPILLPSESEVAFLLQDLDQNFHPGATSLRESILKGDDSTREFDMLLDQALERLAGYGAVVVVIKLGRQGSLVYDSRTRQRQRVPIYPVRAKDPTGAGDAYCGGFLVGYRETGDPFQAAMFATVSASFVIEEFDARYALQFTRRDAEARLNDLKSLLS